MSSVEIGRQSGFCSHVGLLALLSILGRHSDKEASNTFYYLSTGASSAGDLLFHIAIPIATIHKSKMRINKWV
ncbi:hypothetical protein NTE_02593 [Candidatus Nitrososphaera evergladensis SR1]|uniref:Uncharacterized protein n=1 Tax=Candidatus Nitrososphaera evergladensis SR1 TaxID=1459636 RepID=A0A075MST5_9ARCH|nr:hypothetical protein NTE_02593 [Candidatus Nitrososphaera evergladensis SR1]